MFGRLGQMIFAKFPLMSAEKKDWISYNYHYKSKTLKRAVFSNFRNLKIAKRSMDIFWIKALRNFRVKKNASQNLQIFSWYSLYNRRLSV